MSPLEFLKAMYKDGAGTYFDALSVHPYSVPDLPMTPSPTNDFVTLPEIHDLMVAMGDGAKPVWITEYGASTSGSGSVSEETQAASLVKAYEQAANWGWVSHFFWYNWQDSGSDGPYGLIASNGQAKPSLAAFEAAAKVAAPG